MGLRETHHMEEIFENIKNNPNQEKIENAKNLLSCKDITKELITKYLISEQVEYKWLVDNFNKQYVDRD